MVKNVTIKVPTARLEMKAKTPKPNGEQATIHLVPVPAEALAEVQEVLKKYQPQLDKFARLLNEVKQSHQEA